MKGKAPKRRLLLLLIGVVLVGGGITWWRSSGSSWVEPHPGEYDSGKKSTDLSSDLKLIWETQRLRATPDPSHGPNPRSSTDRAINAASRVFNTVVLIGKTRDEVVALLGDSKTSSDSIYNFPFWDAPKRSLVFRFDSGACGWQFNVVFGDDGKVREVERHWIH